MTDTPERHVTGQSASGGSNPELQAKLEAASPRRPWKRTIEVTFGEEEIAALAWFISKKHKGRIREEDAIKLLVRDGLMVLGILRP